MLSMVHFCAVQAYRETLDYCMSEDAVYNMSSSQCRGRRMIEKLPFSLVSSFLVFSVI